jgi:hypothetical protein
MIDVLFEQRVVQNAGLAAEVLWQAVSTAYHTSGRVTGIPFPLAFVVLPLTFHQRTAATLARKTRPGALYKALAEDREITVGLQRRMQAMADRTLQALSIAFDTDLLRLDTHEEHQLLPGKRTEGVQHVTHEVKTALSAAKRVGQAFSEMSIVQLVNHLNIRF